MIGRLGMGENPLDVTDNGPPEQDEAAVSIGDISKVKPAAASNAADSLTGTTIGHYLVGERLGGGAMAAVYRAYDQSLGQHVAIKVVLPGADAVMQARFRREARMVSTLIHPHIVRTLQVGRSGGIVYIAMELVEGTTLADVLERHGKVAVADAARLLAPVAEALAHAHEKGIVHRDVKPSNILLQRATRGAQHSIKIDLLPYPVIPLLSDFGIARALDAPELTNAGRTIGTPAFMAPEQCAGSADIDGRADIYALGAVFYRCLVGRAPFSGSTTQILHAHVYDPLLIPDDVADSLPVPVVRLLARAMMKEPAHRFASSGMMATELTKVANLPAPQAGAQAEAVVDSTMTMASLPVAKSPTTATSRVLVPAAAAGSTVAAPRPSPLKPGLRTSVPATTTAPPRTEPIVPGPSGRARLRRSRWGMLVLVSAFAFLVLLAAGMLVNSVWPRLGDDEPRLGNATATPAAVAAAGTAQLPAAAPSVVPDHPASDVTPDANATGETARPTVESTPTGPTPTPQPPLQILGPTWNLGVASFEEGDWQQAVAALILVQRSMESGDLPDEDEVDPQRLTEMLVTSYVGLATNAAAAGGWERAMDSMEKAVALAPRIPMLAELITILDSLAALQDKNDGDSQTQRATLLTDFADLQADYANTLVGEGKVCDAVIHMNYAMRIADSEEFQDRQAELTTQCRDTNADETIAELGGTILYSSVAHGDTYNIYRMPVTASSGNTLPSAVVVGNASQPRVSPNGSVLAYYSWQAGNDGLYGVRISGLMPAGGAERFSPNPEDSRHSPPSWDYTSSRLAFSTSFVNQAPRIWITSADANTASKDMGYGKDPAWRPGSDTIVFNGPDTAGQNVGLRWMSANENGADRQALSNNGNDQRPVWTSDGRYLVFMSRDRSGGSSWEVYRMEWATGEVILLTDGHDAQDGLPAISPDNQWVAFMSDRGGQWNLYYVSIGGGDVHFLSTISGQPISWLEHSMQWVP